MSENAQWNRESLYEEVWQSPVSKVAEKYGVSNVAIAKVCRKLKIPVPGRGYWARKSAGYSVKQRPLPPFKNAPTLYRVSRPQSLQPPTDPSDPELLKISEVEVKVPRNPTLEHPLIDKARKLLLHGKCDAYGRLGSPSNRQCLDIHVSAEWLDRALNLMNMLVAALEEEGLQVSASGQSTSVAVFGQTIRFGIEEDLQIKEKRKEPSYSGTKTVNVYERSGRIAFRIWSNAKGQRARWSDCKAKKLEQFLPVCIGAIFRHARLNRLEDERRKAQEEEWERQRLEAEERARKEREEQKRFENFEQCASAWRKARHLREFIDAYENACISKGIPTAPETDVGKWMAWARGKAEWLDPLSRIGQ
jgi:hypothetical protein